MEVYLHCPACLYGVPRYNFIFTISQSVFDDENNQIILYYPDVLKQERVESAMGLGLIWQFAVVSGNKWKCAEKNLWSSVN